jgi:hypothetical protein
MYKIPDKTIYRVIFALIVLFNLKYFFLIFQVPFTLLFVDYHGKNGMVSDVMRIKNSLKDVKDFQDEGKTGFYSDIKEASVFDSANSIQAFYDVQYAIAPSVLKNDTEEYYVLGWFDKKFFKPDGFEVYKKIDDRFYVFKRIN